MPSISTGAPPPQTGALRQEVATRTLDNVSKGIPLNFQLLDPEVARKAVEGQPDLLAGEHTKAEAIYRQHKNCPNGCGPTMEKSFGGTAWAFSDPDWLIPRCLMKCHACGHTMNPFDGMTVEQGNKDVAKIGHIPIINPNDDSR